MDDIASTHIPGPAHPSTLETPVAALPNLTSSLSPLMIHATPATLIILNPSFRTNHQRAEIKSKTLPVDGDELPCSRFAARHYVSDRSDAESIEQLGKCIAGVKLHADSENFEVPSAWGKDGPDLWARLKVRSVHGQRLFFGSRRFDGSRGLSMPKLHMLTMPRFHFEGSRISRVV